MKFHKIKKAFTKNYFKLFLIPDKFIIKNVKSSFPLINHLTHS